MTSITLTPLPVGMKRKEEGEEEVEDEKVKNFLLEPIGFASFSHHCSIQPLLKQLFGGKATVALREDTSSSSLQQTLPESLLGIRPCPGENNAGQAQLGSGFHGVRGPVPRHCGH